MVNNKTENEESFGNEIPEMPNDISWDRRSNRSHHKQNIVFFFIPRKQSVRKEISITNLNNFPFWKRKNYRNLCRRNYFSKTSKYVHFSFFLHFQLCRCLWSANSQKAIELNPLVSQKEWSETAEKEKKRNEKKKQLKCNLISQNVSLPI